MVVKSKAEAEKIAVDFVETWKDVKKPKIESSEKVFIEEPKCYIWHVTGSFEWTLEREGYFSVSIHESGGLLGWSVGVPKVRSWESAPMLHARDLCGVTSPETHPEWPEFLKEIGYTAEQYAILDENSKKGLRDSFRKRIS